MQQKPTLAIVLDFIKSINEGLRVVREKLNFPFKLTTYTARHTFSNILLLNGASKEYLQEALGHETMNTTEIYISGFDNDTKKRMSEVL